MKTIEEIKSNCEVFPYDDRNSKREHWVWKRAYRKSKKGSSMPVVSAVDFSADPGGKKTSVQNVRRALRHLATGTAIAKNLEPHCKCRVPGCVSPDCTVWVTRKRRGELIAKDGRWKGDPRKALGSQRRWAGRRKVTPEKHAIIMSDPRPATQLEAELGLDETTITWVRRGNFKGPQASPFAGLLR